MGGLGAGGANPLPWRLGDAHWIGDGILTLLSTLRDSLDVSHFPLPRISSTNNKTCSPSQEDSLRLSLLTIHKRLSGIQPVDLLDKDTYHHQDSTHRLHPPVGSDPRSSIASARKQVIEHTLPAL